MADATPHAPEAFTADQADPHPIDLGPEEHSVADDPAPEHHEGGDAALQAEITQWQDKYTRLLAEFDNYKKRTLREKEQLLRFAAEPIALSLMPVADDIERSINAAKATQNVEALLAGLDMVLRKLHKAFEDQGIQPIDALGKPFDSAQHEAIASLPTDDAAKKGTVIEQVERGYRYHDRVIRYAKVITGE